MNAHPEFGEEVKGLWEILVPTVFNNGKPIHTRYHRVWDAKVREISGGLTIMPVAKGQWVSPEGQLFAERMIPVRVVATYNQIQAIVAYTIIYYQQIAVMAYKISDQVVLRYSKEHIKATEKKCAEVREDHDDIISEGPTPGPHH